MTKLTLTLADLRGGSLPFSTFFAFNQPFGLGSSTLEQIALSILESSRDISGIVRVRDIRIALENM